MTTRAVRVFSRLIARTAAYSSGPGEDRPCSHGSGKRVVGEEDRVVAVLLGEGEVEEGAANSCRADHVAGFGGDESRFGAGPGLVPAQTFAVRVAGMAKGLFGDSPGEIEIMLLRCAGPEAQEEIDDP